MIFGGARVMLASAIVITYVSAGCASIKQSGDEQPGDGRSVNSSGESMESLFAGKFPGVEVSKAPGGGISIRIRGASTVLGSADPLFIIDGARVQSGPGGLVFLDPGDIKSIEVLKDIGSTSLYGSEGANGVILITTKRAR
jgi:TonB-dependent starch-binding outer membrane protein SusC